MIDMNVLIPGFVPVPGAEILKIISIVSLIVGICLISAGLLFLLLNKKKGNQQKPAFLWIFIGVGSLLIVNHSIQLLF